jgi:hypothetical protein
MTNLSISTHDDKLDRRPARASGLGPRLLALLFSSDSMTFPPRISGRALETVARLSRTRIGARLLLRAFRANLRLAELEELADRHFGEVPVDNRPIAGRSPRDMPDAELPPPRASWSPSSETLAAL